MRTTAGLIMGILLATAAGAWGQQNSGTYDFGVTSDGLLPPARHNAYGPGIESDAAGKPFYWAPKDGPTGRDSSSPDPTLDVVPDGYGLGVGRDQYGRPMERKSR